MKNDLKSMFTRYWEYLALNAACELKLFDKILEGQSTIEKLCEENSWDYQSLSILVLELKKQGFLDCSDKITLNKKGALLTSNHPESLLNACMHWADEHLTVWQNLSYTIKTGKSTFEKIYSKHFFDYLNEFPEKLDNYHKAMFEYARDDYATLPLKINFKKHKSILDVGGGYGAAISSIKENCPEIDCALFDLKKVIENCNLPKIKVIEGDFFSTIPLDYDAIVLSRILHDWNDEKCKVILDNCFKALPKVGTLYVIENCADLIEIDLSLLSLNMLAMCESFERTLSEYKNLCESTGYKFQTTIKLNDLQTIIIFEKS